MRKVERVDDAVMTWERANNKRLSAPRHGSKSIREFKEHGLLQSLL